MDFDLLAGQLSPETLAALQIHLASKSAGIGSSSDKLSENSNSEENSVANVDYKKREYWDERFQSEESYEWLLSYRMLETTIIPYLKSADKILIIGCGNSSLSAGNKLSPQPMF